MKRLAILCCIVLLSNTLKSQTQVYELRVYELEFFKSGAILHNYFEKALIPALNRQGAENIGVFEELGNALPKKLYLLVPHKDIMSFLTSEEDLFKDDEYLKTAEPYLKADQATVPFIRINSSLVQSTKAFPNLVIPDNA